MAGVPAGRLSIEIVAEIARLQADLDKAKRAVNAASKDIAANAKYANDNLAGFGRGIAGAGGQSKLASHHIANLSFQLQDIVVGLKSGQKPMTIFFQQGSQIAQIMGQAGIGVGGLAKAVGGMALNFAKAHPILLAVAAAAGAGVAAFKRFTSEIDKSGELEKFANSLGLTRAEMKKLEKDAGGFGVTAGDVFKGLGRTIAESFPGIVSAWEDVKGALSSGFDFVLRAAKAAGSGIYAAFVGSFNALKILWQQFPAVIGEALGLAANAAIKVVEDLINSGRVAINTLLATSNVLFKSNFGFIDPIKLKPVEVATGAIAKTASDMGAAYTDAFNAAQAGQSSFYSSWRRNIVQAGKDRIKAAADEIKADRTDKENRDRRAESLAREIEAIKAGIEENYKLADAYLAGSEAAFVAEIRAKAVTEAIKKQADVEAWVALRLREAVAQRAVAGAKEAAGLREQNDAREIANNQLRQGLITSQEAEDFLKREQQLRPLTIALAVAEGAEKEKLRKILASLGDEIDRNNKLSRESEDAKRVEQAKRDAKQLEDEIALTRALGDQRLKALRGLTGDRLEDELARINLEHEKAAIWLKAQADAANLNAQGLHGMAAAALDAAKAQMKMADVNFEYEKAEVSISRVNDQLREMVSILGNIGGFGGVLGGLLGILSGNTSAVRGPIGDLLNLGIEDPTTKEIKKLGEIIKDELGDLGTDLGGILQSVGQGIVAATAVTSAERGLGIKTSGVGAQIGGTIGGIAAGPVGAAAGAIAGAIVEKVPFLGGLLGMLAFGGTKRGSAIISGGSVSGSYGNSNSLKDQAGQIAGGLLDTLQQIASQFGSTLDAQAMGKISIGVRDGNYAVDTLGRGYTKSSIAGVKSFGKDADAAAEYAIKLMLERGAISMREGSLKIIKSATDLQAGLAKALQFEQIMDMLEGGSSQLVQQVKALRAQFAGMIDAMKEAGASVADLTRAQELQQQRINDLIAQAGNNYRSTFYTDSQNTSFAQQQIHAVLDPLGKGAIDTVGEYMAEVERAQKDTSDAGLAYLDTLYSLTDAFGVLKEASDAAAAAKQAESAQKAADAAQARANAENALRQAYSRDSGALQQTIDKFKGFADTLADFRKEILAGDDAAASYASRLAELRRVGALAGMGDEGALGALPGVGQNFLSAAKDRAGSAIEYQRAVALVARYASTAEQASRGMATEAQKQLDAINKQVGALIDLTDGVLSLTDAINQFKNAGSGSSTASAKSAHREELLQQRDARREQQLLDRAARLQSFRDRRETNDNEPSTSNAQIEERLAAQEAALTSLARNSAEQIAFWKRLSPDGLTIRVGTDGVPLEVAS